MEDIVMRKNRPWLRYFNAPEGGPGGEGGATPPANPTPPPPAPTDPPKPEGDPLGEGGMKALRSEREARAAAEQRAQELADRVKEFEDAQKTQAERDAEQRAELERTATENATKALRYEAAAKAGLPLSTAGRLQGATLDELVADAESFKELLGAAPPAVKNPAPDPSQGRGGGKTTHTSLTEAMSSHYGS
ncbi:hypothetical protein [Prescottella equi]|uniref:hypothetical protein n=1 Tax=Rhodococcus hoagii TaxID=43767 RepID=UPI00111C456C|nr:hypothetical protein [Prescottella equi]